MKITLIMASSVDGVIAKNSSEFVNWTSKADKQLFVAETKKAGVIIMGRNTYETIGKPLPGRLNLVLTSQKEKYKDKEIPGTLEFFEPDPKKIIQYLEGKGFQSAVLAGGTKANTIFFKENCVDEILLTIEPKIFGKGLRLIDNEDLNIDLQLIDSKPIGENSLLLKYKVIK